MFKKSRKRILKYKLKKSEFSFVFDDNIPANEYIVLDTETTGLNPKKDEILSIGATKIKDNKILASSSFEVFIKPSGKISHESIKIHRIRPDDLKNGVTIEEALRDLLHFIGNLTIVGYYIQFDINILNNYLKKFIGTKLPNKSIELSQMYYKRYKKKSSYEYVDLKFDTIMNKLSLPPLSKHDALNDAIMSAMMFLKLKNLPLYKGSFS